jgi:hypothetical protein
MGGKAFRMRNPENVDVLVEVPAPGGAVTQPVYYMPEFEVVDASSISITEIKSDLQASLAQNGFSSHTVETAVYDVPKLGGNEVDLLTRYSV